jgi:hypothetical protein
VTALSSALRRPAMRTIEKSQLCARHSTDLGGRGGGLQLRPSREGGIEGRIEGDECSAAGAAGELHEAIGAPTDSLDPTHVALGTKQIGNSITRPIAETSCTGAQFGDDVDHFSGRPGQLPGPTVKHDQLNPAFRASSTGYDPSARTS